VDGGGAKYLRYPLDSYLEGGKKGEKEAAMDKEDPNEVLFHNIDGRPITRAEFDLEAEWMKRLFMRELFRESPLLAYLDKKAKKKNETRNP